MGQRILVADDEVFIVKVLKEVLRRQGFQVDTAMDGNEAIGKVKKNRYDVALLDIRMPGTNGIQVLKEIKKQHRNTIVVLMTAYGTISNAVEAIKLGAYDYITKPFENDDLIKLINQGLTVQTLAQCNNHQKDYDGRFVEGESLAMRQVMALLDKVKDFDSTVLITGESGTGKSFLAKALHNMGKRKDTPFVHINCASLPAPLIESELFGFERGAFTGANYAKPGKFELASSGTIFLDEISTLTLDLQAKLLTVLEERQFERLGSTQSKKVEARIVAATNRDLEEAVRQKEFRQDLYYRLNVISVNLQPLREHKEDVAQFAQHFFEKFQRRFRRQDLAIEPQVFKAFEQYPWYGNIRELENTIESLVALASAEQISVEDLPARIRSSYEPYEQKAFINRAAEAAWNQERSAIIEALRRNLGHRGKTACELGISRRTLQYKLKRYSIT